MARGSPLSGGVAVCTGPPLSSGTLLSESLGLYSSAVACEVQIGLYGGLDIASS